MRYSEKYQKGYTEKNVDLPLTFNKIFDKKTRNLTFKNVKFD